MPRSRNGAIVIEQESPWSQFLGGFGQGVSRGVQQFEKDAAETKALTSEFLYNVGIGKIAPEALAGADMQAFLEQTGLMKNPQIQAAVDRGKKAMPGASAPPSIPAQIPTSDQASAGIGGGAVNIPQPEPEAPPQSKVNEYLYKEDERKKLAVYEFQRKISSAETRLNAEHANDLRMGNIKSFAEQVDLTAKVLKQSGVEFDDIIWRGNAEAGLSWEINPLALKRLMEAQANKKGTSYTKFETTASTFNEKRMRHVSKLSTFLATDRVDSKALALDSNDPETAYYLSAMAAINGEPDKNKRVALQVEQVEKIVKQLNENIKQ